MTFQYDAICPKNIKELNFIKDNSRKIKRDTFIKNIGLKNYLDLETALGYSEGFRLRWDVYVDYYKSTNLNKQTVYYCRHSSTEYIFY